MNFDLVKKDIEHWIENFVEIAHPALDSWAPCPYARKARLDRDYDVRVGLAPIHDLIQLSRQGLEGKSVVIFVYDPVLISHEELHHAVDIINQKFLLEKDLIALEDHPNDLEVVNGVAMNQGSYALALVQSLKDLDQKARAIAQKGFYDTWPEEYLNKLFQNRQDPRQ
jgi:hypothetical protein